MIECIEKWFETNSGYLAYTITCTLILFGVFLVIRFVIFCFDLSERLNDMKDNYLIFANDIEDLNKKIKKIERKMKK